MAFILIGYVISRLGAVPASGASVLSKMENNVFIPALVLSTFWKGFTPESFGSAWTFLAGGSVVIGLSIPAAILLAKLCAKDDYTRKIYTYGLSFSNFGFMGNAVVLALFPAVFGDYLVFVLPLWVMIYLWGVPYVLTPQGEGSRSLGKALKALVTPMMICMVVGVAIGLSGWQMPGFLDKTVSAVKDCMSPVAMLLTGITVAEMNVKKILSMWSVYVVTAIRLIAFPLLFLGFFMLVPASPTLVMCCICVMAMPLGLNAVVVPAGYGKDTSVAAGIAILSHVLSCATIPVIFYLMQNWVL